MASNPLSSTTEPYSGGLSFEALRPHLQQVDGLDTLSVDALNQIAAQYGLSRHQLEVVVLEQGILPLHYLRNYGTVGLEGQFRLARSCVAVIGLGGLGGYVVEGLARMGMGRLILVDGDVFCDHNLNRQLLSCEGNLGVSKAHEAAARVQSINAAVETVVHPCLATQENLAGLLEGADVVVDALDRLPIRLIVQQAAARTGIPMVHGAIAGWMGQVMTILPGDAGLRALYGDGPLPDQGAEAELGCPAASPMMVAAWQVHETVKILLGQGELLRGQLLFIDAAAGEVRRLGLA